MNKILNEFSKMPLIFRRAFRVTLYVFAFIFGYDSGAIYEGEIWKIIPDVMIEVHGFLLDLIVVVLFLGYLQLKEDKVEKIQKERNKIDEYRGIETPQAVLKIVAAIRRLNELDVSDINLIGCYLVDAKLQDVKLCHGRLDFANLTLAKLHGADLTGAKLFMAELKAAELEGTILNEANLENVKLSLAKLIDVTVDLKTNFDNAYFDASTVCDNNFKGFLRDNYSRDDQGFVHLKK